MKIFYHLSMMTLFLSIVLIVGWLFPILIVKKPYTISPLAVEQGGEILFTSDYCKLLPLSARYTIALVGIRDSDGVLIRKPIGGSFVSNAPVGCDIGNFSVDIPENVSPGKYHIELTTIFEPVPRPYTFESEEFVILKKASVSERIDKILILLENRDILEIEEWLEN